MATTPTSIIGKQRSRNAIVSFIHLSSGLALCKIENIVDLTIIRKYMLKEKRWLGKEHF